MPGAKSFTLKQLRYLAAVAQTGSIAQAAAMQSISVSSVREAIEFAEAKLAVRLFRRTPAKGMAPTAEGTRFIALAEQFLANHEVFEHAASRIPLEWENEFRLGVVATAAPLVLPALTRILAERMPRTRFRFEEMHSEEVAARVSTGTLSAGLTFNDSLNSTLAFVELMRTPPHVGVARNHRLAGRRSIKLDELREEPYILLEFPGARTYYMGLFERHGLKPLLRYVAASREVATELVAAGLGYSVFNLHPMTKAEDRIARIPLRSDYWSPSFGLIYDRINAQTPMLRLLIDAVGSLQAALRQRPPFGGGSRTAAT